jgi:hypothetical protein
VNNSPLIRVHLAEDKWRPARADTIRCVVSHRAKFRFARRTKAFNVANESLTLREHPSKCLGNEVLQGLQELSALCLQQFRIRPAQIQ